MKIEVRYSICRKENGKLFQVRHIDLEEADILGLAEQMITESTWLETRGMEAKDFQIEQITE